MLQLHRSKPLFYNSLSEGGLVRLRDVHFSPHGFVQVPCMELKAPQNGDHLPRVHLLSSCLILSVSLFSFCRHLYHSWFKIV